MATANAEGVPSTALPACDTGETSPDDRGGWDIRSFVANGSQDTSTMPVRPRTTTLGEPCADSGKWAVPVQLTETPPISDYDPADPTNQPSTGANGPCDYLPHVTAITDYPGELVGCNTVEFNWVVATSPRIVGGTSDSVPATVTVNTTTRVATVVLSRTPTFAGSPNDYQNQIASRFYSICRMVAAPNTLTLKEANYNNASAEPWNHGLNLSIPSCAAGSEVVAVTANAIRTSYPSPPWDSGILWRKDGGTEVGSPGHVGGFQSSISALGETSGIGGAAGTFTCSTTRTGATFTIPVNSRYTFGPPTVESAYDWGLPTGSTAEEVEYQRHELAVLATGATLVACPYLVSIATSWCGYNLGVSSCINFAWTYEKFQTRAPYDDKTPDEWNCEHWDTPACDPINFPEFIDYALYDNACPDPPQPAWLDFSWVPATIGYHVECLFVPKGGSDANGALAARWESSTAGQVIDLVAELADAFNYGETCGIVIPATQYVPTAVDSCSWGWAAGARDMLAIAMWIAFALWAAWFVAGIVVGFVNRKSPNPVADGDE